MHNHSQEAAGSVHTDIACEVCAKSQPESMEHLSLFVCLSEAALHSLWHLGPSQLLAVDATPAVPLAPLVQVVH